MTATAGASSEARGRDGDVWTVLRLMRWSGEYLEAKGVERGRLDAEHLLAHALGVKRLQLYLQYDRPLDREELDRFRPLLRRRAEREPLQYILGRAAFRHLDLAVDRRVLIPRPETEVLVDEVLGWAKAQGRDGLTALDVGVGSGAIALSLLVEGPFPRVVAVDASPEALAVAGENAQALGLRDRLDLREGPLFSSLAGGESFDVVVSNPPYVAEAEMATLEPEVGVWEPPGALFAGPDGLAVLRALVAEGGAHLAGGGLLALEVGAGQAGRVVADIEAVGAYDDVRVRRDLAGRERVVLARRAGARPNGD
ncbi:MAG TPA: peptide chain release factor N(5)-glutamine methyltransferase [Longimicrobiales bacterium]|nr:peptide chain release factor N(5)-glutamine methyltransferase [Longimicrobiales bacterium]